jgi:hypothetical protein
LIGGGGDRSKVVNADGNLYESLFLKGWFNSLKWDEGIFYFGIFSEGEGILGRASLRRLVLVLIAGI